MDSMSSSNSLHNGHQNTIKPKIKSSKKKSPSAVSKSRARMTKFNSIISKIKSLQVLYPDMNFQLLKTTITEGKQIGWMKIDYNQLKNEQMKVIALFKLDQTPFKIEKSLNFFKNCQNFQNMWNWSVTNCGGKKIMSEVVNHLNRDMKENEYFCGDCAFNPSCFFLYGQLKKDNG